MVHQPMFLDCPAYLDESGVVRCALPADVKRRYVARSTSGLVEHVVIRCPVGHLFNAPIEFIHMPTRPGMAPEMFGRAPLESHNAG
jgi:hypothetical protein